MKEYVINGKHTFCFVVKKGEVNDVVIKLDALAPIDYKRISEMEAQGGELMRVMRDTRLDNGMNALVCYKDLLVVVPTATPKKEPVKEPVVDSNTEVVVPEKTPRKRGPKPGSRRTRVKKEV